MGKRVIVVGGDAAGMSAASQARRANPGLEVVVLERGHHVSYGACGIPALIAGDIAAPEALVALTPPAVAARGIELRTDCEVVELRPAARQVVVRGGGTWRYDYLVLATGAAAVRPAWAGENPANVVTVRSLQDGIDLRRWVDSAGGRRAVVIGAGPLGLELAEALARRGVDVSLVARAKQLLSGFEAPDVEAVTAALTAVGVRPLLGRTVASLRCAAGRVAAVVTDQGEVGADLVVLALGVRPASELAARAGLPLGAAGGLVVNDRMRTATPGVFAAGDCVEVPHVVTGERVFAPLALTANRTGRVAGDNLAADSLGRASSQRFRGTAGSLIAQVAGFTIAGVGLNAAQATAAGFTVAVFSREYHSRAAYYPGGRPLRLRIVVDRHTRRLLGAQMVGEEGVAGRIDVFAAALHGRLTVDDVYHLDLPYSPPYGPVYDPVIDICGRASLEL